MRPLRYPRRFLSFPLLFSAVFLCAAPAAAGFPFGSPLADSTRYQIAVQSGWNILALPLNAFDGHKDSLFPTSVSDAVKYRYGYQKADILEPGIGFWIKFAAPETISVTGRPQFIDTVTLNKGWNLIGGITAPTAVKRLFTIPQGIITSSYFYYLPGSGYRHADTLMPGTGYWVNARRAGSLVLIAIDIPCPGVRTLEYGGRTYTTVQIGNECWMRQNLDIGEWIFGVQEQTDNSIIEKYCFNDDPLYCQYYGGFYQWGELMQYDTLEGGRGICPAGWHIPTMDELRSLDTIVSGDGNALKREFQGIGEGVGTNETGFSALLTGYRQNDGYFSLVGYSTYIWSSTQFDGEVAESMYLFGTIDLIWYNSNLKNYGFCVRCVKD